MALFDQEVQHAGMSFTGSIPQGNTAVLNIWNHLMDSMPLELRL